MAIALISGGSGLIGNALVNRLNKSGHKAVILTRNSQITSNDREFVLWDGIHPELWTEWVEKADWVINLAGENIGAKRWSPERIREISNSRVFAGELLSEAILRASRRPSVFLQMSAIGYYGIQDVNDSERWDETRPLGNDRMAEICRDWEGSSKKVEGLGVRRLVTRAGLVLSRNGGVLSNLELPFKMFAGGSIGSGKQVYSWIHIDDLIEGLLALLESTKANGEFNLTSPNPATNAEFGKIISQVIQRPYWLPVPAFALRLVLGEMSTLVLDGQRVLPARLVKEFGFQFKYPELLKALKQIHSK
jgi:uncharacterized protein